MNQWEQKRDAFFCFFQNKTKISFFPKWNKNFFFSKPGEKCYFVSLWKKKIFLKKSRKFIPLLLLLVQMCFSKYSEIFKFFVQSIPFCSIQGVHSKVIMLRRNAYKQKQEANIMHISLCAGKYVKNLLEAINTEKKMLKWMWFCILFSQYISVLMWKKQNIFIYGWVNACSHFYYVCNVRVLLGVFFACCYFSVRFLICSACFFVAAGFFIWSPCAPIAY